MKIVNKIFNFGNVFENTKNKLTEQGILVHIAPYNKEHRLNKQTFQMMLDSFNQENHSKIIPIDLQHESTRILDPLIVGYVTQLHLKEDGLWGYAKFNEKGIDFRKKGWHSLSASIRYYFKDITKKEIVGVQLLSIALTFSPRFELKNNLSLLETKNFTKEDEEIELINLQGGKEMSEQNTQSTFMENFSKLLEQTKNNTQFIEELKQEKESQQEDKNFSKEMLKNVTQMQETMVSAIKLFAESQKALNENILDMKKVIVENNSISNMKEEILTTKEVKADNSDFVDKIETFSDANFMAHELTEEQIEKLEKEMRLIQNKSWSEDKVRGGK